MRTVSTKKNRVSTPYLDPSNGQTYFVPADVELAIRRSAISRFAVEFGKVMPEAEERVIALARAHLEGMT